MRGLTASSIDVPGPSYSKPGPAHLFVYQFSVWHHPALPVSSKRKIAWIFILNFHSIQTSGLYLVDALLIWRNWMKSIELLFFHIVLLRMILMRLGMLVTFKVILGRSKLEIPFSAFNSFDTCTTVLFRKDSLFFLELLVDVCSLVCSLLATGVKDELAVSAHIVVIC